MGVEGRCIAAEGYLLELPTVYGQGMRPQSNNNDARDGTGDDVKNWTVVPLVRWKKRQLSALGPEQIQILSKT